MDFKHHDQQGRRGRTESELELAEGERELGHLFAPLAGRGAAPELNAWLRRELRETHKQVMREARQGFLRRWMQRKVQMPLWLAAAACAALAGLAGWVSVLEFGGGESGASSRGGNGGGIQIVNAQPALAGAMGLAAAPYIAHPKAGGVGKKADENAATSATVKANSGVNKNEIK